MASTEDNRGAEGASGTTIIEAALVKNEGSGNVEVNVHGNISVTAGTPSCKSYDSAQTFARLCNAVNEQTHRTISAKITGQFKDENLSEPTFKVYPQMRKVRNFFKGGYEKWDDEIVPDENQLGQGSQQKTRNQMRKEIGFYYQGEHQGDEIITKDKIVETILAKSNLQPQNKNPVTAVVASAGSGKTTLLHRVAEDVLNSCPIYKYKGKLEVDDSHLKMIYFKDMKHMRLKEELKPSQFLFDGTYKTDTEMDDAYEWLVEHQDEAILFFDGLDQATFSIDESSKMNLTTYQKGSASEIMYNILSRNLLPHAKIVIASREFKVSELPAEARPQEIISLVGFKRNDAEKLFKALIPDHGVKIWEDIKKLSPRLLNILSVPVFLVLTAAIMARDPNKPPPTTITELYNRILLSLRRMETIQERRQIMKVIKKLKAMAHQGMVKGRVVFHESDLEKFGLTIQDARDLMIKVPGNIFLTQYLLEGDFEFFFCHQSLQEFLSASFIAEMNGNDFSEFNDSHLHGNRWSVVRTFVSGIIHDTSISQLHEVSGQELKRNAFDQAIPVQIENRENGAALLAAIFESNSDNLIRSLPRMPTMSGTRIGPNEAYMFGSILARRNAQEEMVDLYECGLSDEHITTIVENLTDQRIQVTDLDVKFNSFTAIGLNNLLDHFDVTQVTIDYPRVSEFRYGEINWNNVRKICWGSLRNINWKFSSPKFEMTNEKKIISIKGLINGQFDKAPIESGMERRLSLENGTKSQVLDMMIFFEQKWFEVTSDDYMLLTAGKLTQMKSLDMKGKIKKMLLDCRLKKDIDSSVIVSCAERFEASSIDQSEIIISVFEMNCCLQVKSLDLLVSNESSFIPFNFLSEVSTHFDFHKIDVNFHWWFKLMDKDDVTKLILFVNENQVKSLRLQCHGHVLLREISTIIEKCKIKKLSMKYWNSSMNEDTYRTILQNLGPVKQLASCLDVEYEFVDPLQYTAEIKDAWEEADRRRVN